MTEASKKNLDVLLPLLLATAVGYWYIKKNGAKRWQPVAFLALSVFVVSYLIVSRVTRMLADSRLLAISRDQQADTMVKLGVSAQEYARATQIAERIYKAFHGSWDEDENAAIDAINSAGSVPVLKVVSQLYMTRYGLDLAAEFNEYVTTYNRTVRPISSLALHTLGL